MDGGVQWSGRRVGGGREEAEGEEKRSKGNKRGQSSCAHMHKHARETHKGCDGMICQQQLKLVKPVEPLPPCFSISTKKGGWSELREPCRFVLAAPARSPISLSQSSQGASVKHTKLGFVLGF